MLKKKAGIKVLIALAVFCFTYADISAQNSVVSPYSRIGFGEIHGMDLPHVQAMGGLGSSHWSYNNLNVNNPASYSFLRTASLNAGFNLKYNRLSDGDNSTGIWSGGLNQLIIGFPLINSINELLSETYSDWRFGSAIGILPYSGVGFDVRSEDVDPEIGSVVRDYSGSGGTNLIFVGQSVRYRNTSIGVNIGYLFGSIDESRTVTFPDAFVHYRNRFDDEIRISGLYYKFGFMQDIILQRSETDPYFDDRGKPLRYITVGAHVKPGTSFDNKANSFYFSEHVFLPANRDTLLLTDDQKSSGSLPPEFGFGASYIVKDKWQLGVDFSLGLWSQYENEAKQEELKNSFRVGIGGAYTPNHNSITSFFERVTYRGGLYYMNDPRTVNEQQVYEYGVSLGASFPFIVQRQVSHLNTSFQLGRRGVDNGLQETFFNINLGFTVNDNTWFVKRRFD